MARMKKTELQLKEKRAAAVNAIQDAAIVVSNIMFSFPKISAEAERAHAALVAMGHALQGIGTPTPIPKGRIGRVIEDDEK